jgi:hypothetical protein
MPDNLGEESSNPGGNIKKKSLKENNLIFITASSFRCNILIGKEDENDFEVVWKEMI